VSDEREDREPPLVPPEGVESVLPADAPRIQLPVFEGPLDLLLYLIRRDRIDIHDIPIAPITRQYVEYLDLMKELNLDVAGEFMVMAATLIHIKSKMLVPVDPTEAQGEEETEDPRAELVQRLLEFQRYKEAAGVLITAFREVLERRKTLLAHEVEPEGKTVEQRMEELLSLLRAGESLEFGGLFAAQETKRDMILTFLALLELIRLKQVKVYQRGLFGPIRVFRPLGPENGAPRPVA
jgi:segregation and condensation protein A